MKRRTIIHLDMNAYFASVEQASNPLLRGRPVAVGGGISKRTVIATASYEARARGVKTAMSTWEALRICPELIVVEGDMEKYIYTSKKIFEIMGKYTDLVEVFSIDEAFMDITDTAKLFGGDIALSKMIKQDIRHSFGLSCSIGIGPNKLVAKVASDLKKPDGLVKVTEPEVAAVFEFLPVEDLCGVGRKFKKYLNQMGVYTCGDLARFPVENLIKRFGLVAGVRLSNMGKGLDDSPVNPDKNHEDAKSIGHSYTMPKDTSDIKTVRTYLLNLSERVGRRARKGNYLGSVVSLFIRYGDFSGYGKQKNLKENVNDGFVIFKHAAAMIDMQKPVRLVGVYLSRLTRDSGQMSIIETFENKKTALKAVDEINDRWGEAIITRASILDNEMFNKTGMTSRERLVGE